MDSQDISNVSERLCLSQVARDELAKEELSILVGSSDAQSRAPKVFTPEARLLGLFCLQHMR